MGLTITSNIKKCNIELDGGYGMLMTIRQVVAKLWNEEFGNHYEKLFHIPPFDKDGLNEWNKKAKDILINSNIKPEDVDILDFLYQSDCDGKIKYKTCKKIYDLIKDYKSNICLRYAYYSHNDWEDFKELLLQCYKHRAYLYWY